MKKAYLFLTAVIILIAMIAVAGAEANDEMQRLAHSYVPQDAVLIAQEMDEGRHELKFWIDSTQEVYEIEISADGKNVLKLSSEAMDDRGGTAASLKEDDVQKKALEHYPNAVIESVRLEKDDGFYEYKVAVRMEACYGVITLHAETGNVLERELYYAGAAVVPENQKTVLDARFIDGDQQQSDGLIGTERAKSIALSKAGSGSVATIRLEKDDGRQVYDGKVITDTHEYEFEIDAKTGKIREWDADRLERNERDDDWDDDWDDD